MALDTSRHPCFDDRARHQFARVHLPVAPRCNIQCNFCNRKTNDCLNESRPGVTSAVLTPDQAIRYLEKALQKEPRLSVVGIAGPGDPFANPVETMATLRMVREKWPDMILCVASNGLNVAPYVDEIAALKVSHVTLTINAVDPEIGAKVYAWVRPDKRPMRDVEGARMLLERQLESLRLLHARGVTVKVNTILMPGINDHHVLDVARTVADLGADIHNVMPIYPVEGTPFATISAPSEIELAEMRRNAGEILPQMAHCQRCRADAIGLLGDDMSESAVDMLRSAAIEETIPGGDRPYVAVASMEGVLVNMHLGQADQLWVFKQGDDGFELVDRRLAPSSGGGSNRWSDLAEVLHDCRVILATSAGEAPKQILAQHGVNVLLADALVDEALESVFAGRALRAPYRESKCGDGGCSGGGNGCG